MLMKSENSQESEKCQKSNGSWRFACGDVWSPHSNVFFRLKFWHRCSIVRRMGVSIKRRTRVTAVQLANLLEHCNLCKLVKSVHQAPVDQWSAFTPQWLSKLFTLCIFTLLLTWQSALLDLESLVKCSISSLNHLFWKLVKTTRVNIDGTVNGSRTLVP